MEAKHTQPMGKKKKIFTPEQRAYALLGLKIGFTIKEIAVMFKVHESTIFRWREDGRRFDI
jgi:transposase